MKLIRTEDAVGQVLCHDITQIIKGVTKDAVFRKGYIIREQDIPVLLRVGKEHIYIWENNENMLHENDAAVITQTIQNMLANGCDMVFCTGGMSVDPDDRTPLAIRNTGAQIVSYGAPVLPGAMFLAAYMPDGRPVCGLPGCVMYAKRTIFDLVLPRLLADVPVTAEWLAGLGNGGLCLNCDDCHFPNCGFGKGV